MAEKPISVTINNAVYLVNSDEGEEHILAVAKMVNERINELRRAHPNYAANKLLTLVILQFADELKKLEEEYASLLAETELK
ncbi:MAG: cell division protein ZapA [Clostridia bacterium]|mgnify:CR=1 FL=1|nr:cell division protein ZapA [Clostridia bacterium]MDD4798394.1 cell division protein ZapA [Clostridia bacterium]